MDHRERSRGESWFGVNWGRYGLRHAATGNYAEAVGREIENAPPESGGEFRDARKNDPS